MGFKVMSNQCSECLLSAEKIVDNKRRVEILRECLSDQGKHFICHKATLAGQDVCCHAFYQQFGERVNLIRIAQRLRAVEFIDESSLQQIAENQR